jgi:hypothetical protein
MAETETEKCHVTIALVFKLVTWILRAADSNPSLFLGKMTSFWCQYDRILFEMPCCVYF